MDIQPILVMYDLHSNANKKEDKISIKKKKKTPNERKNESLRLEKDTTSIKRLKKI